MTQITSKDNESEEEYFFEINLTKTKSFEYWLDKKWWNYITEYTPTHPTPTTHSTRLRTPLRWPPFLGHSFDLGETT